MTTHLWAFAIIIAIFLINTFTAIFLRNREKAKMQVKPPVDLKLRRLPGESLRQRTDKLHEEIMNWLANGSLLSIGLCVTPMSVLLIVYPRANLAATVASCAAFFAAGTVLTITRVMALMKKRAEVRLGHAGERAVAEELQPLIAQGYRVYHDVPVTSNGKTENIDHIAVGPHGLVVIETKTRSLSTKDRAPRQEVTFDGERLIWPHYADDRSTVRQVKRCAEWAGKLAKEACERDVPVQQIIAIPGWEVKPGKCYNPRVVPSSGIASAFAHIAEQLPKVLSDTDIKRISAKLDALCRDVEW